MPLGRILQGKSTSRRAGPANLLRATRSGSVIVDPQRPGRSYSQPNPRAGAASGHAVYDRQGGGPARQFEPFLHSASPAYEDDAVLDGVRDFPPSHNTMSLGAGPFRQDFANGSFSTMVFHRLEHRGIGSQRQTWSDLRMPQSGQALPAGNPEAAGRTQEAVPHAGTPQHRLFGPRLRARSAPTSLRVAPPAGRPILHRVIMISTVCEKGRY